MTLIDTAALTTWMDWQSLGNGPIEGVVELGGGTQNIILRFRRGTDSFVLRHPPHHKRPNSDETMRREARILAALAGTDVPHPRLLAACPDETVLGSAFYVMEHVAGANPTVELPKAYATSSAWRRQLGEAVVDGAADIGRVDYTTLGLEDLGRPDGYLERQVRKWAGVLDSYRSSPGYPHAALPAVHDIAAWLLAHRPVDSQPGLMHGDYHFGNVLCSHDAPTLAAVVDWELATIGDPLVDLGWLLATTPFEGRTPAATLDVSPWDGFPTAEEMVDRYAKKSGRDVRSIGWYEVFSCYKLAIIVEGTYARSCAGLAPASVGVMLHEAAVWLVHRASRRIEES